MNAQLQHIIHGLIELSCNDLGIEVPKVEFQSSNFLTNTMLATTHINYDDLSQSTLYIKDDNNAMRVLPFAIAHELRHLWQAKYHTDMFFSDYQTRETLSVEQYNLQPAELDANAYACYALLDMNIMPTFEDLPEEIALAIYQRAFEQFDTAVPLQTPLTLDELRQLPRTKIDKEHYRLMFRDLQFDLASKTTSVCDVVYVIRDSSIEAGAGKYCMIRDFFYDDYVQYCKLGPRKVMESSDNLQYAWFLRNFWRAERRTVRDVIAELKIFMR